MAERDELLLKKRILELANSCYQRDISSYTDFLTLNEQTIFHTLRHVLPPVSYSSIGGYETAERKIVCFLSSYEDETTASYVSILQAGPVDLRFAAPLTHRDYLGAIMNLGIERGVIGDILMNETGCFIFCLSRMADYIAAELTKVGRTPIKCQVVTNPELQITHKYEDVTGSVASARLDSLVALAFRTSRSKVVPYIEGDKVHIDGKLTSSPGASLKGGEIVSVRGLGKFLYVGVENQTKKGRLYVTVKKYC